MPRVKKLIKSDFTTVHNAFARDKNLDLAARGLLFTMLTLPENWNFSIKGLAAILPDGTTRVSTAINRLIEYGYLIRKRVYVDGKISDWDYIFSDTPMTDENLSNEKNVDLEKLDLENLDSENLDSENLNLVNQDVENPHDYKISNNQISNNQINNINQSINKNTEIEKTDRLTDITHSNKNISKSKLVHRKSEIQTQIGYRYLVSEYEDMTEQIDAVVELLAEITASKSNHIYISSERKPKDEVMEKLSLLEDRHIINILQKLEELIIENPENKPRSIKAYLLTSLYNAACDAERYDEVFEPPLEAYKLY